MRTDVPELLFISRNAFRTWLGENAGSSYGVWLVFSKTKDINTISANDALEEALCFGWIDGQMKRIDNIRYKKYFAPRRPQSNWSDKNKKKVKVLREKWLMTERGEAAVEAAKQNNRWNAPQKALITDQHVEEFAKKLTTMSSAYENFNNMSMSVRRTYTKRYLSFKTEEARQRDFEKIVDRLNKNLKPM